MLAMSIARRADARWGAAPVLRRRRLSLVAVFGDNAHVKRLLGAAAQFWRRRRGSLRRRRTTRGWQVRIGHWEWRCPLARSRVTGSGRPRARHDAEGVAASTLPGLP